MKPRDAFLGVIAAGLLAACAAARPMAAPARQAPQGPEPTTVEEAQADIARWREVLVPGSGAGAATTSGPRRVEPDPRAPSTPPAPHANAPTTTPSEATAESRSRTEDASEELSTDRDGEARACVTPCRAIASMRRSVAALCRLSGESDDRCLDARKTLADSEQRVASCGC